MKNLQNIPKFYDVGLKSVSVSVLPTFQNVGVGVGRHQNHGVGESLPKLFNFVLMPMNKKSLARLN